MIVLVGHGMMVLLLFVLIIPTGVLKYRQNIISKTSADVIITRSRWIFIKG